MTEKLPDNWFELILKEPTQRQHLFYLYGQHELLPLKEKELQEKVSQFWEQVLIHHKQWKGNLLVSQFYRVSKKTISKRDIFYNVKEDFMWCCLYNKANYFSYDEKGDIHLKEKALERIVNIDTTYKNEKGVIVKDKSDKKTIATGFTLLQRSIIIDITMIGIIEKHAFNIINDEPEEIIEDIAVKAPTGKQSSHAGNTPVEKLLASDLPIKKATKKKTVKEDSIPKENSKKVDKKELSQHTKDTEDSVTPKKTRKVKK